MAFRGVIEEAPSFGTQLARGLGQGISQGIGLGSQLATQLAMDKYKQNQRSKLIQQIEGGSYSQPSSPISDEQFLAALPQIEQQLGRELTPQDLDQLYSGLQGQSKTSDPFAKAKAYAAAGEHELARLETERAKLYEKQRYEQEKTQRELDLYQKYAGEDISDRPLAGEAPEKRSPTEEEKIKISGFEFSPEELPSKMKDIPPVGPLAAAAKMQKEERREFRKEINEYAKPYQDISELKKNKDYAEQARDLIYNGDVGNSFMRKAAIILAEGKTGQWIGENLKKLATTADEQKLSALMMKFARPKDIGGSNPSTREVLIALERNPDILNHPDANKFLIDEMLRYSDIDYKKGQLIAGLKKYDPYMNSDVFKDLVESKISKYQEENAPLTPTQRRSEKTSHEKALDVLSGKNKLWWEE